MDINDGSNKDRALLSDIPGGVAIYRLKKSGKVATDYVSESLAKLCDYTADEFLAILKDDAIGNLVKEDVPQVLEEVTQAMAEHRTINAVYRIYKKDKTPIMIRLDASIIESEPLKDDDIAVVYAVHTLVSDASRRIMNEQKKLSGILNAVPVGIGVFEVHDGVLHLTYMNDAYYEILHSSRESRVQFNGVNALGSIHPDDRGMVKERVMSMVHGDEYVQYDYRVLDGSDKYIWFHVKASVAERRENYLKFLTVFFDCTESKEQERTLLQNIRAVDLAQEQGDLAIWTYNIDKHAIQQRTYATDIGHMGYKVSIDNVPESFIEAGDVYPDDIETFRKAYRELDEGQEKVDITYRLRNNNTGEYNWLRMFYQRMENSDDNDRMAVGFSMNVDKQQNAIARYRVEQSLRENQSENILMYIEYNLTKEQYGVHDKVTDNYKQIDWAGVSEEEYIKKLSETVEPEFVESLSEKLYSKNMIKAFEAGTTNVTEEYKIKANHDFPSTWLRATASLVKRPDTEDIMAFIVIENIESEKEKKIAIEKSLNDGIESIAIIHISDRRARLIRDDYSAADKVLNEEYFSYDDDFVWRSHNAVVEEDRDFSHQSARLDNVIEKLEDQDIYQYSVGTHSLTGKFKRQLFRFRYLDERRESIVMSVSDITAVYLEEQKKKEQLEAALSESRKASAAKAEFYSRMSHDMRTPMNGILGMSMLSETEMDDKVLRENMKKIHESGEYLLNLINDTLDIQRIESGRMTLEPSVIKVSDIFDSISEMVRPLAEAKNINLNYDLSNVDTEMNIRIDPVRIKQIFINLLSNAIKFTPVDGDIELKTKITSREGMLSHVVLSVQDTGIGMSEDFLKHKIFQPFSQESNEVTTMYAGSGLGLSIVKSLLELMGGHIEVESKVGEGSKFTAYLDVERVDDAEVERIQEEEKISSEDVTSSLKGKNILLIEDHPLNTEIAKKLLERVGCTVTCAQNGKLGAETFASSAVGEFDAILMDIRMPVMDGLEATKQIRALEKADAKTVPIIAMTANAYEDDVKQTVEVGMNAHIAKPIEPPDLYKKLAGCLN